MLFGPEGKVQVDEATRLAGLKMLNKQSSKIPKKHSVEVPQSQSIGFKPAKEQDPRAIEAEEL